MKRIAILIATLLITTSLVGCSSNGTTNPSGTNTTNSMENAKGNTTNGTMENGKGNTANGTMENGNGNTANGTMNNGVTNPMTGNGTTATESGTKGVSDTNNMNDFWWGYNFETKGLNNGVYRGGYIYPDELTVQFTLNGNKIENIQYLKLGIEDKDYLKDDAFKEIRDKYEILLKHLEGKDITTTLNELYTPEKIDGIDSTIEVGKVISAIHDALNRGVFYTNTSDSNKNMTK